MEKARRNKQGLTVKQNSGARITVELVGEWLKRVESKGSKMRKETRHDK